MAPDQLFVAEKKYRGCVLKIINLLFSILLCSSLFLLIESGIYTGLKLDNYCKKIQRINDMNFFIYSSFKNTCNGNGFSSLEEWQKNCNAMWNLSYIGFCPADDFMNYENNNQKIMYGMWIFEDEKKEVYCIRN